VGQSVATHGALRGEVEWLVQFMYAHFKQKSACAALMKLVNYRDTQLFFGDLLLVS
jgi:hypothetical protein